jgi:hypothetical protein
MPRWDGAVRISESEIYNRHSFAPGSPWRVWLRALQRKPRDQRRSFKTRCGTGNKDELRDFASRFLVIPAGGRETVSLQGSRPASTQGTTTSSRGAADGNYSSITSFASSFGLSSLLGKCRVSNSAVCSMPSKTARVKFSF